MPERGPGPRPELMQRREKEPARSPVKRKLALATALLAGVGAMYEKMSDPDVATDGSSKNEHHQEVSAEQQRNIEALRSKLVMAAQVLKDLPPLPDAREIAEANAAADAAENAAKEDWFELHSALQNAEINLENARTNRSRDNEYGSLQERLSQHPEAMAMFDANFSKVKLEHTEDGIYAHLDGDNGFELVVTADVDPDSQLPVLSIAGSTSQDTYTQPMVMDDNFKHDVPDLDGFVDMKVENQIESMVMEITKAEIKAKYPDYVEPRWEAPETEEPSEEEEEEVTE